MNAAEIDYYEQRSVTKFVLQLHLDALRIVPLWALKIKCSAKNDVMVKERETALRRQQEQDAVMTLRITKALIPDNHDASDGQQLVIVAGSKPKAATNNKRQSVGAAPLLDSSVTCCVRECGFLMRSVCDDKCRVEGFCDIHGPLHEQHAAQMFKPNSNVTLNAAVVRGTKKLTKEIVKLKKKNRINALRNAVDGLHAVADNPKPAADVDTPAVISLAENSVPTVNVSKLKWVDKSKVDF